MNYCTNVRYDNYDFLQSEGTSSLDVIMSHAISFSATINLVTELYSDTMLLSILWLI